MKSAGKARNNGLYRHIRTSKEIIRNLLNDFYNNQILAIFRMLYLINNTNPFPIWKTWFGFFWFGAGDRT